MSRQREYQKKLVKQGLCGRCGSEPLNVPGATKTMGKKCAKKMREKARKVTGSTRRYKNAKSYTKPAV